jgi:hypothetical protein
LKENRSKDQVVLEIKTTDKMTENQLKAFVLKHFSEKQRLNLK